MAEIPLKFGHWRKLRFVACRSVRNQTPAKRRGGTRNIATCCVVCKWTGPIKSGAPTSQTCPAQQI